LNGAQLSASNFGRGQAGSVIVEVLENAVFDGFDSSDGSPSGAFSSILPDGQGVGGDVRIAASNLEVTNGAQLSAAAFGLGDAGNVIIEVKDNVIFANINTFNGRSSGAFSSILPNGEGAGGDIHISATNLVISDGANVSANALGLGNAGNIVFQLSERLLVDDGTIATNARFASGGEVIIETDSVLLRRNSDIQTFVNVGEGKGGDVVIRADSILAFEDSDILAFAQDGQGGNITLDALGFFGENYQPSPEGIDPLTLDGNDRVDINASGAVSGIITLPDISFIENSLTELPDNVVNTEQLIAGSCIARTARGGSFIVSGSGGLPDRPGDAFLPPYPTGEIRSLSGEVAADSSTPTDEIVEPQGVFQLADGQIVISRLCESE
jgi:large exoprotein involved in heme utilization and adhesion